MSRAAPSAATIGPAAFESSEGAGPAEADEPDAGPAYGEEAANRVLVRPASGARSRPAGWDEDEEEDYEDDDEEEDEDDDDEDGAEAEVEAEYQDDQESVCSCCCSGSQLEPVVVGAPGQRQARGSTGSSCCGAGACQHQSPGAGLRPAARTADDASTSEPDKQQAAQREEEQEEGAQPAAAGHAPVPAAQTPAQPDNEGVQSGEPEDKQARESEGEGEAERQLQREQELEQQREREQALLKRSYVLNELVQTERDYVADLGKIVEGYLDEIRRQLVDAGVADVLTTGVLLSASSASVAPAEPGAAQTAPASGGSGAGRRAARLASVSSGAGEPGASASAKGSTQAPHQHQHQQQSPPLPPPPPPPHQQPGGDGAPANPGSSPGSSAPPPTANANAKAPPLPDALKDGKHKIIFGNIEAIYEFHRDHFLRELERCLDEPHRLGALFKRYERRLNMYVVYCQNKPRSEAVLSEYLDSYFENPSAATLKTARHSR